MISRLDVKNRFQGAYRKLVEAALYRFQDLYMHMPVREDARADDDRPTNMRNRGRSDVKLMQVSELLDELSIHCS